MKWQYLTFDMVTFVSPRTASHFSCQYLDFHQEELTRLEFFSWDLIPKAITEIWANIIRALPPNVRNLSNKRKLGIWVFKEAVLKESKRCWQVTREVPEFIWKIETAPKIIMKKRRGGEDKEAQSLKTNLGCPIIFLVTLKAGIIPEGLAGNFKGCLKRLHYTYISLIWGLWYYSNNSLQLK